MRIPSPPPTTPPPVTIAVNARRVGVAEAGTDARGDFILTPNLPASVTPGTRRVTKSSIVRLCGSFSDITGVSAAGSGPMDTAAPSAERPAVTAALGRAAATPLSETTPLSDETHGDTQCEERL